MPTLIFDNKLDLNPFSVLFASNEEIFATMYRKTLLDKYLATLGVLTGQSLFWSPAIFDHNHCRWQDDDFFLGLYDYITLGMSLLIPLLEFILLRYLDDNKRDIDDSCTILDLIIYVFFYPLMAIDWAARFIFGFIGLIIATPLIIGIHLYVNYLFRDINSTIKEMQIETLSRYNDLTNVIETKAIFICLDQYTRVYGLMVNKNQLIKNETSPFTFIIKFNGFCKWLNTNYEFTIHIRTPEDAHHLTQLAKINFAGIGNLIKQNKELQQYIEDVSAGKINGLAQARSYLFSCLLLLRKFPAEMVRLLVSYGIPEHTIYTGVSFTENKVSANSFFNKANRIYIKCNKLPVAPSINPCTSSHVLRVDEHFSPTI